MRNVLAYQFVNHDFHIHRFRYLPDHYFGWKVWAWFFSFKVQGLCGFQFNGISFYRPNSFKYAYNQKHYSVHLSREVLPIFYQFWNPSFCSQKKKSFIFQLLEYPCNITHDISFLIYQGYI